MIEALNEYAPVTAFVLLMVCLVLSLVLAWRWKKLYKPVLSFWALAALVGCFGPAVWTAAWHVRHGNGIEYRGKWIPVPTRWVGESEPQGASLTKLPLSILQDSRLFTSITVSVFGIPKDSNAEKNRRDWEMLFRLLHSGPDSVVSGPRDLDTASGKASCMEFHGRRTPNRLEVSCLLFDGKWTADFMGSRADSRTFFRIVKSIR